MSKTNEYIKKKWGNRSQKELCEAIAEKKGLEQKYYKGYVNKWFNTEQEPGKDYLLVLSQILNVSVESILRGEDIINGYGDRPTAYSAALSGDARIIDRLFGNEEYDVWLHTTDEYGKSFVDYVIEFNNYSAFKTAIEKGYGYPIKGNNGKFRLNGCSGDKETDYNDYKLTKMIIENDDKEMFIRAFGMDYYEAQSPISVFYNHRFLMNDDIVISILKTNNILEWLLEYRRLSEVERNHFAHVWTETWKSEDLQSVIDRIPSVLFGFNYLLKKCIENDLCESLMLMINRAADIVQDITDIIKDIKSEFKVVKYYDSSDMVIQEKARAILPLGFVPYIEDYNRIKDEELRKKAIMINEKVDQLRRTI